MSMESFNYRASDMANLRVMDTTIWQACKILGYDPRAITSNWAVFHELYEMYYAEELAAINATKGDRND